ncbi:MAG: tRNA uridine-5-carboxymethylaminomethyl(34) synthesis GTPase MnmE [Gammaproteobacteria bacterium]|nr:tRNA uridine-5-carboxymethylaminomethyl(34) synthesis GTPase MnmE [Gammaproteobacteria bacterium]
MTTPFVTDTIAAIATAPGKGGVGVVRVSGPNTALIAKGVLPHPEQVLIKPRYAQFSSFNDALANPIDEGLAIYFPAPNSFTGEDVLEIQGHGGPVILNLLLERVLSLGARLAKPGEFSERAFLNDKIDLTQAEAIADLIDAASEQAARCAVRSLQGAFSQRIEQFVDNLIKLRSFIEAAIDFPEEEIDFLRDESVLRNLKGLEEELSSIFEQANQGSLLKEGMEVVIAGKPNAGKSSLLNALAGRDSAIVTEIAGTTRDILREHIHIDGLPLHLIDTAGLRESEDPIEQEGVRRAWTEIGKADQVLLVVDGSRTTERDPVKLWPEFSQQLPDTKNITVIVNKLDLYEAPPLRDVTAHPCPSIYLSAKQGTGITTLKTHLKNLMGYSVGGEGGFIARQRHLVALKQAQASLASGIDQLTRNNAGELLAEELRYTQEAMSEITGEFHSDDLLGKIFSSFCIGK